MDSKQFIVAIEIGSSHVAGTAAAFDSVTRDVKELCYFEEPLLDCVKYGSIVNVDEMASKINIIVNRIEKHERVSPRKISSVYIGVDARSMHSEKVVIEREINEDFPITETQIDGILREAESKFADCCILKTYATLYEIDGTEVVNPVGAVGSNLKAVINVIVCRQQISKNINLLLNRCGLKLAGLVCVPFATTNIVLDNEEKRLGSVLVDWGADTTSVSIVKNNKLEYLNVLPMGSRNITRDLASLKILEDNAEKIKKTYGITPVDNIPDMNIAGVRSIDVVNYIKTRVGEIVANIQNQISVSGFTTDQLPKGIVLTGRGAKLSGLVEFISQTLQMPVRLGYVQGSPSRQDYTDRLQSLAILDETSERMTAFDTCLFMPEMPVYEEPEDKEPVVIEEEPEPKRKEEPKKPTRRGIFGSIGAYFTNAINAATGNDSSEDDE